MYFPNRLPLITTWRPSALRHNFPFCRVVRENLEGCSPGNTFSTKRDSLLSQVQRPDKKKKKERVRLDRKRTHIQPTPPSHLRFVFREIIPLSKHIKRLVPSLHRHLHRLFPLPHHPIHTLHAPWFRNLQISSRRTAISPRCPVKNDRFTSSVVLFEHFGDDGEAGSGADAFGGRVDLGERVEVERGARDVKVEVVGFDREDLEESLDSKCDCKFEGGKVS